MSADVTAISPRTLTRYTEVCGRVLAHAHARTGDPALITGYLGTSTAFDNALTGFAVAYADQTDRAFTTLQKVISEALPHPV